MAEDKDELILKFQLDQTELLKGSAEAKKAILSTKDAQKELNKTFKDGKISVDEYAAESVKLENQLKREKETYNQLTKAIDIESNSIDAQRAKLAALTKERNATNQSTAEGVKQVDKLNKEILELNNSIAKHEQKGGDFRRNVGAYTNSIKDAAGQINIAGVNVGSLTDKIGSFVNPATAAVGVVTALGAAYANSTRGAKDLEFAQNQLAISAKLISNSFAELITSGEDGEGFFTGLLNKTLSFVNNNPLFISFRLLGVDLEKIAKDSKSLALVLEQLEDLGRKELEVREKINERLGDNQELMTEIQSEQTKYNEKIDKSNEIITNLYRNQDDLKGVLEEELALINKQLAADKDNEQLQTAVLQKKKEISNVERDTEQAQARKQAARGEGEQASIETNPIGGNDFGMKEAEKAATQKIDLAKHTEKFVTKFHKEQLQQRNQDALNAAEAQKQINQLSMESTKQIFGALAGVFQQGSDLQKTFAIASLATDTAEAIGALTAAAEENPANGFTFGAAGIAQYTAGIVRILNNVAQAKRIISQAAGGGDFITKGPTLLMVGDNPGGVERVSVEPVSGKGQTRIAPMGNLMTTTSLSSGISSYVNGIKMAGGGTLTAYNDGGMVKNSLAYQTDQYMMIANILKQMPPPVVSVKEITDKQTRIQTRQNL
jgi:hypothetical protein